MRDDFDVVNRVCGTAAPRPVHEIRCSRCAAVDSISASKCRLPPHTVAVKFSQRGWRVVGVGKHLCPACVAVEGAARKAPPPVHPEPPMAPKSSPAIAARPATSPATSSAAASPTATAPAPTERPAHASPTASQALVDFYLVVSDHYDAVNRRYQSGWDDERVARETGLALAVVRERRERDFGPLERDTTREDLARALDLSGRDLRRAGDLLQEVGILLSTVHARHEEVAALAARLAAPAIVKAA